VFNKLSRGGVLKTVFFGTPEFAVPPLNTLLSSGHDILAVVTQPDRQSGRGKKVRICPVKNEAQKKGIRIMQPERVREAEFIEELRGLSPAVIAVVAYGQILPPDIINLPELGCVNVHASLLPKYRGAAPINWAIINGEKVSGVSTMLMDEGMDTGPVLQQQVVEIAPEDTAGSLSTKLAEEGARLLLTTLEGLQNGNLNPQPQTGEATYAPVMNKRDGLIQWTKPAPQLCNFIRGMNPWPGAYGFLEGGRIKILKAEPVDRDAAPGTLERVSKGRLYVGAGQGTISILEIQPPGKPAMTIHAFLQGRNLKDGMRFAPDYSL
jgi:methionyl-tRNA formyltransferase